MIGGMLAASAIGIFLIPAIFYVVEKLSGAQEPSAPDMAPVAGAGRLSMKYSLIAVAIAAVLA